MTPNPKNSVQPKSRAEWRAWLAENHAAQSGVWLITHKKATGKPRVEYGEALEEALCFGWLEWILTAKKPETRAARVAETARLANQNLRANQWRRQQNPT